MKKGKQWWYFTFGSGQKYAGKCVKIYGSYFGARHAMFEKYGVDWGVQDSEEKWEEMKNDPSRTYPMEEVMEEFKYEAD